MGNLDIASYDGVTHSLHFWSNDVGMVSFFALAANEVVEAMLPGGPLASPARAMSPLAAAVGGMAVPAAIDTGLSLTMGPAGLCAWMGDSCAADIAVSARFLFPARHPALPFLLLLAIADDALLAVTLN